MPVGVMLRTMDSAELTEWMAYFAIQREGPAAEPEWSDDPEEQSRKLKAVLFRKVD